MSYNEDIRDSKRKKTGKRAEGNPASTAFVAFHPTKEEKEILATKSAFDLGWAEEVLSCCLEAGAKFACSYRIENRSFCAMLRDGTVQFDQSTTLSCFQASLEKAMIGLAFFVKHHYPHFPDEVIKVDPSADYW